MLLRLHLLSYLTDPHLELLTCVLGWPWTYLMSTDLVDDHWNVRWPFLPSHTTQLSRVESACAPITITPSPTSLAGKSTFAYDGICSQSLHVQPLQHVLMLKCFLTVVSFACTLHWIFQGVVKDSCYIIKDIVLLLRSSIQGTVQIQWRR